MRVSLFSVSVVCSLIGRRIKCTRKQTEDIQSQAVVKEAVWEEYIVVSEAVWLPCSSFEARAETVPAAFGYLGVVRKKPHRVFHIEAVHNLLWQLLPVLLGSWID